LSPVIQRRGRSRKCPCTRRRLHKRRNLLNLHKRCNLLNPHKRRNPHNPRSLRNPHNPRSLRNPHNPRSLRNPHNPRSLRNPQRHCRSWWRRVKTHRLWPALLKAIPMFRWAPQSRARVRWQSRIVLARGQWLRR
jgi:hypothetical protein